MKTRQSLVSNSSSCSFTYNGPIKEIALGMWKVINNNNRYYKEWYSKSRSEKIKRNIIKLCNQKDVQTGIYGICFPSTNYNTYIRIDEKGICNIDTSNNYDWNELDVNAIPSNEDIVSLKLINTYYYHTQAKNLLLLREHESLPENSTFNLICPKCTKKWGEQKHDDEYSNDYYYVGIDGKRYCDTCYTQLQEKQK